VKIYQTQYATFWLTFQQRHKARSLGVPSLAARRGRPYLYGLSFTFAAYVFYDLARFLHWPVEGPLLSGLFLVATITALLAVWGLYRDKQK
jgi:hypothetical protein